MLKFNLKRLALSALLITCFSLLYLPHVNAQNNDLDVNWFNILPELTDDENNKVEKKIEIIWQSWWKVMENYNKAAAELTTSEQVASWIMNWDTILNYLKFFVGFLSQLGLVVWTGFIIYAWYKYIISVFNWWKVPTETIKNAIIGVIIIIFSYAIMKTLTSLVGIT